MGVTVGVGMWPSHGVVNSGKLVAILPQIAPKILIYKLEKVGQAIEGLSEPPRFQVIIPDGKPVNVMAPTLCHPKRRKVANNLSTEVLTLIPASAQNLINIPAATALQAPPPPMFVRSQLVDTFKHGHKIVSVNDMDLGHTRSHKSCQRATIPAQAPILPAPQSNQSDNAIPPLQPMPNATLPSSSQYQVSHLVPSPHTISSRRGGCNDTNPLSSLIEIDDREASDPNGQNSPYKKLSIGMVLMEWDLSHYGP
ncbi:hypothetical protein J3A83DRAFT_4197562 [Scleroderma citrinum]